MMNSLIRHSEFVIRVSLGASEVAGDEEFELGVGEEVGLRARVLEAVYGPTNSMNYEGRLMNRGILGCRLPFKTPVIIQHAHHIMRGRVEARLDDRLDAPLANGWPFHSKPGAQPAMDA